MTLGPLSSIRPSARHFGQVFNTTVVDEEPFVGTSALSLDKSKTRLKTFWQNLGGAEWFVPFTKVLEQLPDSHFKDAISVAIEGSSKLTRDALSGIGDEATVKQAYNTAFGLAVDLALQENELDALYVADCQADPRKIEVDNDIVNMTPHGGF